MANFAERIAYWYLRLNGFFLLENFVHHQSSDRHGADADLLALRLPRARELIDGREVTCDEWRSHFGFGLEDSALAVLVQVKGGDSGNVDNAFRPDRLADAARRFGSFDDEQVKTIASTTQRDLTVNGWRVAKLVIGIRRSRSEHAHFLSLHHTWDFIRDRFMKFQDRKRGDWDHFPDELVQLLAWRISEGNADI